MTLRKVCVQDSRHRNLERWWRCGSFSKLCLTPDLSGVAAVPLPSADISRSRGSDPRAGASARDALENTVGASVGVEPAKLRPRTASPLDLGRSWVTSWTRPTCRFATVATPGRHDVTREDLNAWHAKKPVRDTCTVLDLRSLFTGATMSRDRRGVLDN